MAADPLRLAALRRLGVARNENPPWGWLPERVLIEALCPLSAMPAGGVRPGDVVRERQALGAALSELQESGAVAYAEGRYRLTRVGGIALAVAEAEARDALRRRGGS